MHWNKVDVRLRELVNCVAKQHNEGSSYSSAMNAEERQNELLEELTNELEKLKED